jgi:hypothetical protein
MPFEPSFDLQIAPVEAQRRKLKTVWTEEAVYDFVRDFGGSHPGVERSAVDRLAAIAEGKPDPGQWIKEPVPSPEAQLMAAAAAQIQATIDDELGALR